MSRISGPARRSVQLLVFVSQGRTFSASHIPEKSGLPSAVRGVGAPRFGNPLGVVGTPAVGYVSHCAGSGALIAIARIAAAIERSVTGVLYRILRALAFGR